MRGTMSTFGGPSDPSQGDPNEGLALYTEAQAKERGDLFITGCADMYLNVKPGLFYRLDPNAFYIACRWDYDRTSKEWLRGHTVRVTNVKTGAVAYAWPVDWGPNSSTGRITDLSPGIAEWLELTTDDVVEVEFG